MECLKSIKYKLRQLGQNNSRAIVTPPTTANKVMFVSDRATQLEWL